jgi:hypothetical protein
MEFQKYKVCLASVLHKCLSVWNKEEEEEVKGEKEIVKYLFLILKWKQILIYKITFY